MRFYIIEINSIQSQKTERKEEVILENLIGYRQRTRGFMMDSLPLAGGFETNPELRESR